MEKTYIRLNNQLNQPANGVIQLEKDQLAVKAYFKEEVLPNLRRNPNTYERIQGLIQEGYYEWQVFSKYSKEFLEKIYAYVEGFNFRFKSLMGAHKFYKQYSLRDKDGKYLETYEDRVALNALYLADGNESLAQELAHSMMHQVYQPATPTFMNVGKSSRGSLISCFLINVSDDLNSIGRSFNSVIQLSKQGGGVGISLTNLRESGAPIKGIPNSASGVVPVMKNYEDQLSYANQLGQRQGAGAVYLSVFHPDIMEFLSTKKENADEKIRVKTLSLGLTVPDKYYELVRNDEDMYLFSPYDVEREYGVPFSELDITAEYENLVANPNIKKKVLRARDLETEISKLQQESGYPYIINIDVANRANPVDGNIIMSNLCVTGDTLLLTDNGYVTARKLFRSTASLQVVIDDRTKEMNFAQTGTTVVEAAPMALTARNAEVYQLTTEEGFNIKATEWHKFYIYEGKKVVKKQLNELHVGDQVLMQSAPGGFGDKNDVKLVHLIGKTLKKNVDELLPTLTDFKFFTDTNEKVLDWLNQADEESLSYLVSALKKGEDAKGEVKLILKNENLAEGLQLLLLKMGIISTISPADDYSLVFKVTQKPTDLTATIASIEKAGVEDVYDTTQEDYHSLIFNGFVTGNCSEILQSQTTSKIRDDQTYEVVGEDISCNLGSINIPNIMQNVENFGLEIATAVKALTYVTDNTAINEVPSIKHGNDLNHTIGLGAMGLHTYLALAGIHYDSMEAVDFAGAFFYLMNYYSLVTSNQIATERATTFHNFDLTSYKSGEYFEKYIEGDGYTFKTDRVAEIFSKTFFPKRADWEELAQRVADHGLYHRYRLATAPTGSISYINETSASIHPITQIIEERDEKKTGKTYYPAPYLSNKTLPFYKSAFDMDMRWVIDVYAAAQEHVDQGMSLTLFLREDIPDGLYEWKAPSEDGSGTTKQTTRDLSILRNYAYEVGVKTLYYVRTYREGEDDVTANQCESCSI